jgi:hypothetical protein
MPCVTVSILEEFSVIVIKIKGYLLTRSQASFLLSKLTRKGRERKEYQSEIHETWLVIGDMNYEFFHKIVNVEKERNISYFSRIMKI